MSAQPVLNPFVRGIADARKVARLLTLKEIEFEAILSRLNRFGGNRVKTVDSLGISRRKLGMRLAEWRKRGLIEERRVGHNYSIRPTG